MMQSKAQLHTMLNNTGLWQDSLNEQAFSLRDQQIVFHVPIAHLSQQLTQLDLDYKQEILSYKATQHRHPNIKNIIAIGSGKGGVGKSTLTTLVAQALTAQGAKTGILDADIYGPSQPTLHNSHDQPTVSDNLMTPLNINGVELMSIGLICDPDKALMWRGPMISKTLIQMFRQTKWSDLDYLLVDLPPGTGDIPISLCQNMPLTAYVSVTTPHPLAQADVTRFETMMDKLSAPIIMRIENNIHQSTNTTSSDSLAFSTAYQSLPPIVDEAINKLSTRVAQKICELPKTCTAFGGIPVTSK